MKERFRNCAFFDIVQSGPQWKREIVIENMCKPYCKESCPILPILEFTGDSVVPYIEKGTEIDPPFVDLSAFDKYIKAIYERKA